MVKCHPEWLSRNVIMVATTRENSAPDTSEFLWQHTDPNFISICYNPFVSNCWTKSSLMFQLKLLISSLSNPAGWRVITFCSVVYTRIDPIIRKVHSHYKSHMIITSIQIIFGFFRCYCVTEDGNTINGYNHNLWETNDDIACSKFSPRYLILFLYCQPLAFKTMPIIDLWSMLSSFMCNFFECSSRLREGVWPGTEIGTNRSTD